MKIALALIVKGSDDEAKFLERCLHDVSPYVDGIYVTITHKYGEPNNAAVMKVAKEYGAMISHLEWNNDFAYARNFNFSQVSKMYDYIMWCDADDTFIWLKELAPAMEANPDVDAWTFQYYYHRDEFNNPTVIHTKTQVVKNDGTFKWIGKIHENFEETREHKFSHIEEIKRIHLATDSHNEQSKHRNLEISIEDVESRPNDPTVYFNLGNAYFGVGSYTKARTAFKKFLNMSNSDDEKYLIHQRLAHVEARCNDKEKAVQHLLLSIGMKPNFPDSYNLLGYMYSEFGDLDKAEFYLLYPLAANMKPQYQRMIVYNPRDYDYNPMKALANVYFKKNRPDLALPMLEGCLMIYPDDLKTKKLVDEMRKETDRLDKVITTLKHIETLGDDKEKILYAINKLPADLQSHPGICKIRNQYEIRLTSTGKDIAYYCGETVFDWNPELFKIKGFGGSEEAVINLSKEWAKQGYNVTVYNSCGIAPMVCDGVTYKPWWMFNAKDKWDQLIVWRSPKLLDYELNVENIYIDLHDVVSEGEFTEKRLNKIKKIFVKTKAHRVLFPRIPDYKFAMVPNGMDFELFDQDVKRDPYMLINTSSPDRSMDVLPALFKEVKKQVPQARLKWAYGWDNYDKWHASNKMMMDWKEKIVKEMQDAGIEDCGRLSQKECAKLYLEGSIMAYPSDFYEIDCISVKKAQACGCIPVTTDFAAFKESVKYGVTVHTDRTIKNWSLPYQIGYGTKYMKAQKEWIDAVVKILKTPMKEDKDMIEWTGRFAWPTVSKQWTEIFK